MVESNSLKDWLDIFTGSRLFTAKKGDPLYSFRCTTEEFEELRKLLINKKRLYNNPTYGIYWAAGYCLYASERYRRDYAGGEQGWTWQFINAPLGCDFTNIERNTLVKQGLVDYWERSIAAHESGNRDYLGSLFREGGLSWKLAQSKSHGFGRCVRGAFRYLYSGQLAGWSLENVIRSYGEQLPNSFNTNATYALIAEITQYLVALVQDHSLGSQSDPSAYLLEHEPEWTENFPVPIGESNAQLLVNEWLKDAIRMRNEAATEQEKIQREFNCIHFNLGGTEALKIRTQINLPSSFSIAVTPSELSTSRIEVGILEGGKLLARGNPVYAAAKPDNDGIIIKFPDKSISLRRRNIDEPLILRLSAGGKEIALQAVDDSDIEIDKAVLVFDAQAPHQLLGTESCSVSQSRVLLRLPKLAEFSGVVPTHSDSNVDIGIWYDVEQDVEFNIAGSSYSLALNSQDNSKKMKLDGRLLLSDSLPTRVYFGWPIFRLPENSSVKLDELSFHANGEVVENTSRQKTYGSFDYQVRDKKNRIIFKRRFGVVPPDFNLRFLPAYASDSASVTLNSTESLNVQSISGEYKLIPDLESGSGRYFINTFNAENQPCIEIDISQGPQTRPIRFKSAYPQHGATLLGENNELMPAAGGLLIDDMLGKRVRIVSTVEGVKHHEIKFECRGYRVNVASTFRSLDLNSGVTDLSLYDYRSEVIRLLSATSDQDAFVRLTIHAPSQIFSLDIKRYNASLRRSQNNNELFELVNMDEYDVINGFKPSAMLLSDPARAKVSLPLRRSEYVPTGSTDAQPEMHRDTPWLIYPEKNSSVKFRPVLFVSPELNNSDQNIITSLHDACRYFNPNVVPSTIDNQISAMARNPFHSGWQYFEKLLVSYDHLPLSCFEVWKSLARNHESLCMAVFRLNLTPDFCERIADELAVVWDTVPLYQWASAIESINNRITSETHHDDSGPSEFGKPIDQEVAAVIGISYKLDHLKDPSSHIFTSSREPIFLVQHLFLELLRSRVDMDEWPDCLGDELSDWVTRDCPVKGIERFIKEGSLRSVAYLPIFIGCVRAGVASLEDIDTDELTLKFNIRTISDFDQFGYYRPVVELITEHVMTMRSKLVQH